MHRCGLLTSFKVPVPLKSISVDVIIRGFVADVISELQYQNKEDNPVEVTFVFPLDDEAAVYAFEGLIGGTRIEAKIREKKQAKQEYDDALSEGHQAFLLEREENTSDIFTCNLGNLPPGAEATLKLRYVQALAVEPDEAVRFVLPAVLNPRYVPEGSEGGTVTQQMPRVSTEALPYTLSLSAKVESPYGINRVDSKCSLIQNMSEDYTAAQLSQKVNSKLLHLPKGFPLVYKCWLKELHFGTRSKDFPFVHRGDLNSFGKQLFQPAPGDERASKSKQRGCVVSLAKGHQFDRDVELLIYYKDVHKTSAILEVGKPGTASGSLMGDPALLLSLYPNILAAKAGQHVPGEFIFLLDRSGSMDTIVGTSFNSLSRIESAKETLIFLLKSLPLGCYFNIYGFGSTYDSFYPQSVKYTQQTMDTSVQRVKKLRCDLGGTEIVKPLKAIYSQPCLEGHPRQIFVFTDGEVSNTNEVIAEVRYNSHCHRCFSFGIGEGTSTSLVKGIARAAGGSAEFITGKERMQAKALQSLKKALQPAVTGISVNWELPAALQATLVGSGPQVIFQGQRCLIYAQIQGQLQASGSMEGAAVVRYNFQNETFTETTKFSLQLEKTDRLPVHRLAAQALLQELEEDKEKVKEKQLLALETSLSSGVVCSQTAYVGVNTELGKPVQGPLLHRDVPFRALRTASLAYCMAPGSAPKYSWPNLPHKSPGMSTAAKIDDGACFSAMSSVSLLRSRSSQKARAVPQIAIEESGTKEESPLLKLVSLQNADGSWPHGPTLAAILDLSEAEISGKAPANVASDIWATVLAVLWLHLNAAEQKDEWELLEGKAVHWLQVNAGDQVAKCVKAGNAVLGGRVSPQVFGL